MPRRGARCGWGLLLLLRAGTSAAAFLSPSTRTYTPAEGTLAEFQILRVNVFDPAVPGEGWWPFRLGNRIHLLTHEPVVRREILQAPGDAFDPLLALETERNLRASGFIRKAEVRPWARPDGLLDLHVITQDAWSLSPQASVGTEGGERYLIWGVEESNLLGLGKSVSLYHSQVGSANRNEFRYRDPRLGGTRQRLTGLYATTATGDEIALLLDRPFFALHSPYSLNLLGARILQEDILYHAAEERSKFIQNFLSAQASIGVRINQDDDPIQRILLGTHYQRDRFERTDDTLPETLPADRELSGPIAGYSLIQPRFIKETYINTMERVEDFNLGHELTLVGGPMLQAWGSDRDRWPVSVLSQQGWRVADGRFLLGQGGLQGRLAGGRLENGLAYGSLNLFWKTVWALPQTWVIHAELNAGRRLDGENQLILGGTTGLRGYRNNGFTGAKSALLNIEDRLFLTKELIHLFHLGAVAFFDTGAAAPEGGGFRASRFKSDVGLGLRLTPSRSTTGTVFRLDVAYALNSGPGASRWVMSVRGGQAFQIFNSTSRNVLRSPSSAIGEESASVRLRRR